MTTGIAQGHTSGFSVFFLFRLLAYLPLLPGLFSHQRAETGLDAGLRVGAGSRILSRLIAFEAHNFAGFLEGGLRFRLGPALFVRVGLAASGFSA